MKHPLRLGLPQYKSQLVSLYKELGATDSPKERLAILNRIAAWRQHCIKWWGKNVFKGRGKNLGKRINRQMKGSTKIIIDLLEYDAQRIAREDE